MIIAIEGGDQTGKMTQAALLQESLCKQGHKASILSFPDYTTPTGMKIKDMLHARSAPNPRLLHKLLAENRREKRDQIASLSQDAVLILDRYKYSNLAYGMANGMEQDWLEEIDSQIPEADIIILLDMDPIQARRRKHRGLDSFESNAEFAASTRMIYLQLAQARNWKIVDATGPQEQVQQKILKLISMKLNP